MVRWIKRSRQALTGRSLANFLFRWELLVFLTTVVCSLLLFSLFLQLAFLTLWDRVTVAVRAEIEKEADTIARLLVFEFSHLSALETHPALDPILDQLVERLLWEKVTFNETIRGIELIGRQTDDRGQHLTYSFFPITSEMTAGEQAPKKQWRRFTGPEAELLRVIFQERRIDRTLLEVINQGRKAETELSLRYFPLYIPLPDRGAVFWGVVKVGISVDAMRRFLLLLDEERDALRYTLMGAMTLVTGIALGLGVFGFRWLSRRAAAPLAGYVRLSAALESAPDLDPTTLTTYFQDQDHQQIEDYEQLQQLCLKLSGSLESLANYLVATARQAASGRLLYRALLNVTAQDPERPAPALWLKLFDSHPDSWGQVNLNPILEQFSHLLPVVQPAGVTGAVERQPIPPLSGSADLLVGAFIFLLDMALTELPETGHWQWRYGPGESGGLRLELSFSGRVFTEADLARFQRPWHRGVEPLPPLGPFLAAAIVQQHGGTLSLAPRPEGGLAIIMTIPGEPRVEAPV